MLAICVNSPATAASKFLNLVLLAVTVAVLLNAAAAARITVPSAANIALLCACKLATAVTFTVDCN